MKPNIAGAGLAGLLAAHAWPQAEVFDPMPEPRAIHKALLRFRSKAVAQLIGIEFSEVTVRKAIWERGKFIAPSIRAANHYSAKILGRIEGDRSIWNLDPVTRYIAPESLYEQLVESVGKRIYWGMGVEFAHLEAPLISTAPLPVVLEALRIANDIEFKRAPIHVARYRVPKCAVYQTVYFPDPELQVYRASITGDLLIVESMSEPDTLEWVHVLEPFGIYTLDKVEAKAEQRYGKIVPLPDSVRKPLLAHLTSQHRIFSLGRFATWRNILLDDVVDDIAVVRRLLRASEYEHRLHFS